MPVCNDEDGQIILTRHFMWRQAKTALITSTTQTVFLVSEIAGEIESGIAAAVLAELSDGVQTYFEATTPKVFLVDEQRPTVVW